MKSLKFRYKLILILFFGVLLTSLWSNNIYILVLFSSLTYLILPLKKYWDGTAIALLIFSALYAIMTLMTDQYGSGFMLISYIVAPVAFYRFGRWSMSVYIDENARQKFLFCIIICYLAALIYMTIKDILIVGIVNTSRVLLEDPNNDETLAATLYGLMASVGIGLIAVLFTKIQNFWLRLGYIILALMSLLVVVHLVNRTGLVIFVACIVFAYVASIDGKLSKMLLHLIPLCCLLFALINTVGAGDEILAAYQQREMDSSVDASQVGGRSEIWSDAIKNLLTHPLGWDRVRYAHNLWLDIARVGGWLPLIMFFIVTFNWVKSNIKLVRYFSSPFILTIISTNISMFLASFVEPVIDASILYFVLLLMIWGMTISLSKEKS